LPIAVQAGRYGAPRIPLPLRAEEYVFPIRRAGAPSNAGNSGREFATPSRLCDDGDYDVLAIDPVSAGFLGELQPAESIDGIIDHLLSTVTHNNYLAFLEVTGVSETNPTVLKL